MSKIKDIKDLPVQNQQDYVYLIDNDSVTKTEADNTTVEINVVNTTDTTFEKVANINNENLFSARENNKKYVKKFHTLKIEKEITSSSPGYVYVMIPEIANVKFNEGDSDKYKLYKMMKERGWNYYPAHGKYFRKDENALHDISFLYPYQYPETGEYHYMMAYIYETSNGGHNTVYMPFCDFAEYENNLSFTALEDNSTITLEKIGEPDAVNLIYSTKKTGWEKLIPNETVITLKQGEAVYIKGNNATFSKDKDNYYHFAMTGRISAGGNINTLLSKNGNIDTLLNSCYIQLFQNCTSLVSIPDLSAKVLQNSCYTNMFVGCSNINKIEVDFTNWLDGQTVDWVNGVAENGTFICPEELPIEFGEDRIPVGWTVLTK